MVRMTPNQFLKEYPETAKLFETIKGKAPVKIEELQRYVQPHPDQEINERRLQSMISNLSQFRLVEVVNGIVCMGDRQHG